MILLASDSIFLSGDQISLTVKKAIIMAAILEFLGAFLVGGHVTKTVRGGILDPIISSSAPELMVYGMMAALMAAGTWLMVASRFGWPVSTTHSIVGGILGAGLTVAALFGLANFLESETFKNMIPKKDLIG